MKDLMFRRQLAIALAPTIAERSFKEADAWIASGNKLASDRSIQSIPVALWLIVDCIIENEKRPLPEFPKHKA